jgi:chemotaxis protein CheZ
MDDTRVAMHCEASSIEPAAAVAKPRKTRARKTAAATPHATMDAKSASVTQAMLPVEQVAVVHGTVDAAGTGTPLLGALPADSGIPAEAVYQRIGHLTRTLHDALRELGYDKELQGARDQLPDARDRLTYIARVTGEAAEKVLNAVDQARVVQEQMTQRATDLRKRWQAVAQYTAQDAQRATPAGRQLVDETCSFFDGVGGQTDATQAILTDIMMAQDFHDLTGQVIRKVVTLAQNMEEQLLKLLIETTPPEQRRKLEPEILEGPVVKAEGRTDVVTDQAGVDDLLASLGF